ncbi:hypothetical protein NESM_000272100 [Novymonas esmeraldas]|uniref:Uncharacterized protein n=1 Tax=Novymonas esmeraldas TaxID=1808958 RepID=A0AAW0F8N3_9TRYP
MADDLDGWDAYRLRCIATSGGTDEAELQDRLGIVEDFLTEHAAVCTALHAARRTAQAQERRRVLADEAEERRFVTDDAEALPWRLLAAVSFAEAQRLVVAQEAEQRRTLMGVYAECVTALLVPYEELQRLRLTWEALDSLALKACIVGRYGVREGQLARTSIPGRTADCGMPLSPRSAAAMCHLRAQERDERRVLVQARLEYVTSALLYFARSEKLCNAAAASLSTAPPQPLLSRLSLTGSTTVRRVLDESATRIQAAYRGYCVRGRPAAL